jgi:ribosomal RNA-processing protein 9
MSKHI